MLDEKMSTERDPFRVARAESDSRELEKIRQEKLRRSLKAVLASRDGRCVLWGILSSAGIYRSSFSTEAAVMAFNEGQRNVGLRLLDQILSVDREAFNLMQDEANERREQRTGRDD